MRHAIGLGLVLLSAAGLTAAPGPKDPPFKSPAITGRWVLVRLTTGGTPALLEAIAVDTEFTADGRRVSRNSRGQVVGERSYTIDRNLSPPTFDLRDQADGPATCRGVYKVDGDTFTICYVTEPDAPRPTDFKSPDGSKVRLAVYKRMQKDRTDAKER